MKENKININIEGKNWRVKPICKMTNTGFVQLSYNEGCALEYCAKDEDSWIVMSFFHVDKHGEVNMDWVREDVFDLDAKDLHMWQSLSKLIITAYATFGEDEEDDE